MRPNFRSSSQTMRKAASADPGALVADLERRRVLRAALAPVVEAGGRDVGVPEPFLVLGDIRLVLEGVGRRGRPQRVHADGDAELPRVAAYELVDPISGECPVELAGAVVADWAEEGAGLLKRVPGG